VYRPPPRRDVALESRRFEKNPLLPLPRSGRARFLSEQHLARIARHVRERCLHAPRVLVPWRRVEQVVPNQLSVAREQRRECRIDVAGHAAHHAAGDEIPVEKVSLHATNEIIRQRFDLLRSALAGDRLHVGGGAPGHRVEKSQRVALRRSPGDLAGGENRRGVGHVGERIVVGGERRAGGRAADASRIERVHVLRVIAEVARVIREVEYLRAFDEKRPLLREERLECRQVQHGRIDFDLSEVRIQRCVECEVRREPVLEVEARAHGRPSMSIERIVRFAADRRRLGDDVREQLEVRRGRRNVETEQMPVP
jgi:hypothetical protein